MTRPLQGHYVTISTGGGHAKAFVPAPLPLHPPVEWSPALRALRSGPAGTGAAGRRLHPAAGHRAVSPHVCAQGSRAFFDDRRQPILARGPAAVRTGCSAATINKALASLQQLDVLRELTSDRRNRLFCYHEYVEILNRGAELPG
jgi:hypothetical protein